MLYALDTEFMEDGNVIKLISIGIVCEDGREFYRQVVNADYSCANKFVLNKVIPQLIDCQSGEGKSQHWSNFSSTKYTHCQGLCPWQWYEKIGEEIRKFCVDVPEFITYYGAYDWVALCQLFGTMMDLPHGWPMFAHDIRSILNLKGLHDITQPDDMPHNALSDARWIIETYKSILATVIHKE